MQVDSRLVKNPFADSWLNGFAPLRLATRNEIGVNAPCYWFDESSGFFILVCSASEVEVRSACGLATLR